MSSEENVMITSISCRVCSHYLDSTLPCLPLYQQDNGDNCGVFICVSAHKLGDTGQDGSSTDDETQSAVGASALEKGLTWFRECAVRSITAVVVLRPSFDQITYVRQA